MTAMDEFKVKDANGVVRMIKKRMKDFKGSDRCWNIERGLLENLSGPSAATRVQDLLLTLFPSKDHVVKEAACLAEIQKLISADGFKMLPYTEQATIKFAASLVQAVENVTPHLLKVGNVSESSVVLWQACAFFVGTRAVPPPMQLSSFTLVVMQLLPSFILWRILL